MESQFFIRSKKDYLEALDYVLLSGALASYAETEGEKLLRRNDELSKIHEFRMPPKEEKALRRIFKKYEHRQNLLAVRRIGGKAITHAAVIFLVLAIGFGGTLAVSAEARRALYKMMFTYEQGYTLIGLDHAGYAEPADSGVYTWDYALAPTIMPEYYQVDSVSEMLTFARVSYTTDDGRYLDFLQSKEEGTLLLETDEAEIVQHVFIGESEGLLVVRNGVTRIVWRIGDVMLKIESNDDSSVVMAVAKGIRLLK
ncbi:hypothetical protein FACS1894191_5700 [Clostridia bacterium]|nr:hypothetical protein FACS1894191_5700 [Clostridia bacterium]